MYYIILAHEQNPVNFWYSDYFKMVFEAVPFSCRCPTPISSTVYQGKIVTTHALKMALMKVICFLEYVQEMYTILNIPNKFKGCITQIFMDRSHGFLLNTVKCVNARIGHETHEICFTLAMKHEKANTFFYQVWFILHTLKQYRRLQSVVIPRYMYYLAP